MRRNIMPITRRRDEEDGFDENGVLSDGCRYRGPMYALDAIRLACCTSPLHLKTVAVAPDLVMRAAHRGTVSQDVQTDNCEL
jgi:hypothetical protein